MRRRSIEYGCRAGALSVVSFFLATVMVVGTASAQVPATDPNAQVPPGAPPILSPDAVPGQPIPPIDSGNVAPAPPPIMLESPAMPSPVPPPPPAAAPPPREMVGSKFTADIYGFAEFDAILDSTQSLNEIAGNSVIAKSGAFAGDHSRLNYSARNSRLGFKFKGPDSEDIRTSGILEMDFLGNQPPTATDAQLITNPTFRVRHAMLKVETPFVDIMAGQYWQLFGWQSYFFPNTVEIMGVPGEVFGRAPQLRLSHAFKTEDITLEVAAASSRSPQRDGGIPDTQGGVRFLLNGWKALHTANSTGTAIDAGGIGVSGAYRRFRVNEFAAMTDSTRGKNAGGISVDALIPVLSPAGGKRGHALTLTGSYVRGTGIADLYTGLVGGIGYPALPNPTMAATPAPYVPNIDPGLVTYGPNGDLHSIDWQSFIVGAQYYLPPSGTVWISGNYSQMDSPNIDKYTTATTSPRVVKRSQWADGNLFWDVNKAVRFGVEFAWFKQKFVDASTSKNYRGQFSAFYLF